MNTSSCGVLCLVRFLLRSEAISSRECYLCSFEYKWIHVVVSLVSCLTDKFTRLNRCDPLKTFSRAQQNWLRNHQRIVIAVQKLHSVHNDYLEDSWKNSLSRFARHSFRLLCWEIAINLSIFDIHDSTLLHQTEKRSPFDNRQKDLEKERPRGDNIRHDNFGKLSVIHIACNSIRFS